MEYRIIIDRGQAIWAVQEAVKRSVKALKEMGLVNQNTKVACPPSLVNALLSTVMNSPGYAFMGMDLIYLQGKGMMFPEEYTEYILSHEVLHLLVHKVALESGISVVEAGLISGKVVDSELMRFALAETYNLDYAKVKAALREWIANTLPPLRFVKGIIRRLRNAFSKNRGS